ncbi:site-specific integrase [uncultured Microbacterium sp.]|uniref:tyrosine-type recombinase/integrase n=1 Tax=uncultured Microbacterium sp. TaxID=191216 RepID=UPI0025D33A00|nr:site-specific integrase [uncultured Microbacterium sp.]
MATAVRHVRGEDLYNKRDAERHRDRVERELHEGNSTEHLSGRTKTFRQAAEAMIAASAHLAQKTLDGYEIALRVHAYPTFGNRRISTIKADDLDKWLSNLRAKPKANGDARTETSVLGTYKVIRKVFSYAYAHRLIPFNPCIAVTKPKADTAEARFLTVEEVNALAAELITQPPYDLLVRFAALTGLRIGEVAALRVRDVDVRRGEVNVKLNKTHKSKGYITGAPKSRQTRTVPILDEGLFRDLGIYLRNHPHRDNLEAGLWPGKVPGHRKISHEYALDPKGFYRYTFKPACDRAGLSGLHFHELRHTFATLALESGALDMHELSRALGHANYGITDKVYARLRPRDYSRHRAAFSGHIAAASGDPAPVVALGR